MEVAKRRLIYTLLSLGLPVTSKVEQSETGLAFEFLADPTDPTDPATPPVLTGHDNGLITVNIAEADDAERERRRHQMGEPYRTVLGHFRHEIGHYYWDVLIKDGPHLDRFRELFGDEREDYGEAASSGTTKPAAPSGLAGSLHLRLRDRPSVGRLGRNVGALPTHHRHARNSHRVRLIGETAACGRAVDEAGREGPDRYPTLRVRCRHQ